MRAHRNDVYRARRSRGKVWPVLLWILAGLIVLAVILFYAGQKYIVYGSDGSLHVVFPIMATPAPVTDDGQPETVDTELVLEDPDYSGIVSDAGAGLSELHAQYLTADKITPEGLTRAAASVKAAGGLHGCRGAREPFGRDLVGGQILRVQLREPCARVGDDAGVVRIFEHELGVDRLRLAVVRHGGGRRHDGKDDVQRAVAAVDDVFLAGVEQDHGQHDQSGEDPQEDRPDLAPAAPGAVDVVSMGAHRHTSFGSGGFSRGFRCR